MGFGKNKTSSIAPLGTSTIKKRENVAGCWLSVVRMTHLTIEERGLIW
jgi:hypothetical protein